jgi:riboflavin kinase / FMN adenylyltransferase
MKILGINDSLPDGESTVLTVGNFDGVHRGHLSLIRETVRRASDKKNTRSAVVTFDPPTRLVIGKEGGSYRLLTTFDEKKALMEMAGVDYLMRVPFDRDMSRKGPEAFIDEVLKGRMHMTGLVLGRGHAFGRNRSGNENFLHIMEGKYHFTVFVSDLLTLEGNTISSTQIREYVMRGRIAEAVIMLGHPYLISVERIAGKRLGTKLGYPTLNFKSPPSRKVIPLPGVYAAELEYKGTGERGALYFGECPTLQEHREVHFEFHSFNRGKDEIEEGERAQVWLYSFVRPDKAFTGTGELALQIGSDIETIRTFFTKENVQWR